jgi:hypothetical protein
MLNVFGLNRNPDTGSEYFSNGAPLAKSSSLPAAATNKITAMDRINKSLQFVYVLSETTGYSAITFPELVNPSVAEESTHPSIDFPATNRKRALALQL